jgi:flagellar basal-body rod protein FlgF
MDRLIYVAMTGAKHTMWQQASVSHNLANAVTTGYRAEKNAFRALPVFGDGLATRTFVVNSTVGADFTLGPVQNTGRDLDVSIEGKGWIAVQAADGTEAYTRNGSLQISPNGVLQTRDGFNVLGDGGVITVPPDGQITIGRDGTISTIPSGQLPNTVATVGRVKLVNPPEAKLVRGDDGLFRLEGGGAAPADAGVKLISGAVEGSNVNMVDSLVSMISLQRQFDMQIKLLQSADNNDRQAGQILTINA